MSNTTLTSNCVVDTVAGNAYKLQGTVTIDGVSYTNP